MKLHHRSSIAALLITVALPATAPAAEPSARTARNPSSELFRQLDTNNDSQLSREEFARIREHASSNDAATHQPARSHETTTTRTAYPGSKTPGTAPAPR